MLNVDGVTKTTLTSSKQISAFPDMEVSVGVIVKQAVGVAVGSKKIAKAGTPLHGDLTARGTAFEASVDTSKPAIGVLKHDVDVTSGDANGTLIIFGFVIKEHLESDVSAKYTAEALKELAGRVWLIGK